MLSATRIKNVCVFLSVREPAVTVHLTGFFHTPKLLQPQLRNPENCKQAIHGLGFHTSLNSLLYHIIAFNWFCCFKCNLWHELERCRYYKVRVFFFFVVFCLFFFNLTVMRYLRSQVCDCVRTCSTSWLVHNRSLQTGLFFFKKKCVKQVRETCQLDNCVR